MDLDILFPVIDEFQMLEFDADYYFSKDSIAEIPEFACSTETLIDSRQRFASNGLLDNLVIRTNKKESTRIGLWILGAYFQQKHSKYVLRILDEESGIKQIWLDFRGTKFIDLKGHATYSPNDPVEISIESFNWSVKSAEDFGSRSISYLGHQISCYVTNEEEDVYKIEHLETRDILIGFGKPGGGLLAAEFFLSMGLIASTLNYEYIKYEYGQTLADNGSCEIRVEVFHEKIDSDYDTVN